MFPPYVGVQQAPAIAAQDLPYVFKAGYLEKRRKGRCWWGGDVGAWGCVYLKHFYFCRAQLLWNRVAEEMVCPEQ
jgi:hypothetical protein